MADAADGPRDPRSPRRERPGIRLAEIDELELEIEKLVTGGEGFGRYQGVPIFVPRSAPGDRLRVRLVERRPDYGRAEIVEILTAGPGRREAPCPYFTRCGGCDLQHLEDDVQVRAKVAAAGETLRRLGGIELPSKVKVVPGRPFGYRLRTQLQVAETARGREVGYFARGSHDLVAIDRCPILVDELSALIPSLPRILRDDTHRRVDLAAGDAGQLTAAPRIEGLPHGEVTLEVGGLTYGYDAGTFFQAHRDLVRVLVAEALGDPPPAGEDALAVDLFAGVGLFALPLAQRYGRVIAVEGQREAARHAQRNARRNGIANLEVVHRSAESWAKQLPAGIDRLLIDPPRAGLPLDLKVALRKRPPRWLTYVSCNAATLARDLKVLRERYVFEELVLLDMFPQTGHLEAVAQLRRRERPGRSGGAP